MLFRSVRAEHIQIQTNATSNHPKAQVTRIERLSDQYLVHVRLADCENELIISVPPTQSLSAGQSAHLNIVKTLWFDEHGQRVREH